MKLCLCFQFSATHLYCTEEATDQLELICKTGKLSYSGRQSTNPLLSETPAVTVVITQSQFLQFPDNCTDNSTTCKVVITNKLIWFSFLRCLLF